MERSDVSLHPVTLQRLRVVSCHENAWLCVVLRPFLPLPLRMFPVAKLCDMPFRHCYEYSDL